MATPYPSPYIWGRINNFDGQLVPSASVTYAASSIPEAAGVANMPAVIATQTAQRPFTLAGAHVEGKILQMLVQVLSVAEGPAPYCVVITCGNWREVYFVNPETHNVIKQGAPPSEETSHDLGN